MKSDALASIICAFLAITLLVAAFSNFGKITNMLADYLIGETGDQSQDKPNDGDEENNAGDSSGNGSTDTGGESDTGNGSTNEGESPDPGGDDDLDTPGVILPGGGGDSI